MNIIDFYLGNSPDSEGRMLDDILAFTDGQLEATHDYIQVLFPLREPSPFNENAPLLTDAIVYEFTEGENSLVLRSGLFCAFLRMLKFYRFDLSIAKITISDNFDGKWITKYNHNFRRITRILTCLHTLGLEGTAKNFLECLESLKDKYGDIIGETTYSFWQKYKGDI